MPYLTLGGFTARMAADARDLAACRDLRTRAFGRDLHDGDRFDAICAHLMVEDADARPVCCFRILPMTDGGGVARSYAAQYYDLSALAGFAAPLIEIGRFCLDPGRHDADILRVAWAALTRYVDARGIAMLFGCASFAGVDPAPHAESFALLRDRFVAPARWRPARGPAQTVEFASFPPLPPDVRQAMRGMPPLLRTYLAMGGRVSDHAVIDRAMGTLHVFTGVEVAQIPAARARLLRALGA